MHAPVAGNPVRVFVRNKVSGVLTLAVLRMHYREGHSGRLYYTGPLFANAADAQHALSDYGDTKQEYVLLPAGIN